MSIDHQILVGMQRGEFAAAAKLQAHVFLGQLAVTILTSMTVLISNETVLYMFMLIALLIYLYTFSLQMRYRESRSQAERARRATLLMDGLGEQISQSELRTLELDFTISSEAGKSYEDKDYYSTTSSPGEKRFTDMLDESTFWSAALMRKSANKTYVLFALFFGIGVFLLFFSVPFISINHLEWFVRAFCSLLVFIISSNVYGAASAYSDAANKLEKLVPRIAALKNAGFPKADLLLIFSDYNSAVEGGPMVACRVYDKHKDHLNKLWTKHQLP